MASDRAATISRADLLRCLVVGKGEELDGVASALGFVREARPEIQSSVCKRQPLLALGELTHEAAPPVSNELPPVEQERIYFYRVTKREPLQTDDKSPTYYPDWYTENDATLLDKGRASFVPQHQKLKFQPLIPWARLWPFLHNTLSNLCSGWQPDMEKVVKRVAHGEFLRRIPVKTRKTWASAARVLIDINAGTFALRYDFIHLRDKLLRLRGEYGLHIRYLEDEPGGNVYYWENQREVVEPWTAPTDMPLLIISDLGALTQSRRKLYAWLVFGRELASKGCRPVVLMPVPVRMIDPRLLQYFDCVSWDRGSRLKPLLNARPDKAETEAHQAKVRQLLNRLAPALRVNSTLLRATRYLLTSESFDVGHEAAVWQHPAIQNHGDEFVWQVADHEPFLQAFRQLPAQQQRVMVDFIARYHATLSEVVYFEAMHNCLQLSPEQVDAEVQIATRCYMAALLKTFNEYPEFKGLEQWTNRFVGRQQANVLRQHNATLAAIKGIQLRRSLEVGKEVMYPTGIDKELMQPFLSGAKERSKYELRQQGRKLVFVPEGCADSDDGFGAQGSLLTTLESGVDFIVRNSTTQEDLHILRFDRDKTVTVAMAGTRSYELETDRERITVEPLMKPEWAVAIGNDTHGLYIESKDEGRDRDAIYREYWHPPSFDQGGNILRGGWSAKEIKQKQVKNPNILLMCFDLVVVRQLISDLEKKGFNVYTAYTYEQTLHIALEYFLDAALVSQVIPKTNSNSAQTILINEVDVIRELRNKRVEYPIIVYSARDRWQVKVAALDAGADDYITLPFHFEDLVARLRVKLRRTGIFLSNELNYGPIRFNTFEKRVFLEGREINMSTYEYHILIYLVLHAGELVSKNSLFDSLYEESAEIDDNVLEMLIRRLRIKLDPLNLIETVQGKGYRFSLKMAERVKV